MATVSDKLGLTNPVIEKDCHTIIEKHLTIKLIKGRAIKEMVVASVYASCKEISVPKHYKRYFSIFFGQVLQNNVSKIKN